MEVRRLMRVRASGAIRRHRAAAAAAAQAFASTEAARAQDRCQVSSLAAGIAPVALATNQAFASADAARVQVGFCHVSLVIFDCMMRRNWCTAARCGSDLICLCF